MADKTKVLFKMGNKNNLPTAEAGSLIIAKDTKELFADTPEDGRIQVGLTEEEAHANNLFQIEKDDFNGGTWYCWPWRDQMQTQLTLEFTDATEQAIDSDWAPSLALTYFIYVNDKEYRDIAYISQDQKIQYLGNGELLDSSYKKSATPFVIWWDNDARITKIKFKEAFTGKIAIKQNIYSAYIILPDTVQIGSGGHIVAGDCPSITLSNSIFQLSPFFEIQMRKELDVNKLTFGSNLHAVYVPDPLEEDPTGQNYFSAAELQTQMVNKRYVDNKFIKETNKDLTEAPAFTTTNLTSAALIAHRLNADTFILSLTSETSLEATAGDAVSFKISIDDYQISNVYQVVMNNSEYLEGSLNNYDLADGAITVKSKALKDITTASHAPIKISIICGIDKA